MLPHRSLPLAVLFCLLSVPVWAQTTIPGGLIDIEPRAAGGSTLEATFNGTLDQITATDRANISIVGAETGLYLGGVTLTLDPTGSILTIDLDPPLGDQDCYTIGLAGMTSTEGGDILNPTFTVRTLVGDVNRSGRVNATDKNLVKGKIGEPPLSADDFLFDVNRSGRINATDTNLVKGWIGHTVAVCP